MPKSHSPHGECGLKCDLQGYRGRGFRSLPAWGVRVEIFGIRRNSYLSHCHSPHGECGLKWDEAGRYHITLGHSPHGECGLK